MRNLLLPLLFSSLLVADPAAGSETSDEVGFSKAKPVGNPSQWFAEAANHHLVMEDSVSRIVVKVDKRGAVDGCEVTVSSGNPQLDETICEEITRNGAFEPARDQAGEPIQGTWSSRVTWKAQGIYSDEMKKRMRSAKQQVRTDYPSEALAKGLQGTTSYRVVVGVDGWATDCEILRSSGHKVLDDATCSRIEKYGVFHPAVDADGNFTTSEFEGSMVWKLPK